ncbi:MAG: HPr family phosphocarrier protein [Deltaproteobacteria bacterium]|nr:HPr family phosphocarrier protein [Deltaproteobacteria bacterium]
MNVKTKTSGVNKELVIRNSLGLHARAAAQLVKLAAQFDSVISFEKDGNVVDAKSVLSLLTLECPMGSKVLVHATGEDSEAAVEALENLILNNFGES